MQIAADGLVAQLTRTTALPAAETSLALPAGAPNDLAVARFAAIMKTPEVGSLAEVANAGSSASAIASASRTTMTDPTPAIGTGVAPTMGDRMLENLQTGSDKFKAVWNSTYKELQSDQAMSLGKMMAMQLQVTQMAVQYELLGKVISKATQNVDQLVRVQ